MFLTQIKIIIEKKNGLEWTDWSTHIPPEDAAPREVGNMEEVWLSGGVGEVGCDPAGRVREGVYGAIIGKQRVSSEAFRPLQPCSHRVCSTTTIFSSESALNVGHWKQIHML